MSETSIPYRSTLQPWSSRSRTERFLILLSLSSAFVATVALLPRAISTLSRLPVTAGFFDWAAIQTDASAAELVFVSLIVAMVSLTVTVISGLALVALTFRSTARTAKATTGLASADAEAG